MFLLYIIFFISLHICFVYSDVIQKPQNLPCKLNDRICMKQLGQWIHNTALSGAPENGVDGSDPMYFPVIDGDLGYVKYQLKNSTLLGLKRCEVKKTSFNSDINHMQVILLCPHFDIAGAYDIDGSVLTLPIQGNGDYNAHTTNYNVTVETDVVLVKKQEKLHAKLKQFTIETQLLGIADFELKNLFGGDKELSDNIHKFGRENARAFAGALDKPFFTALVKRIMKSYNHLLKPIPITDLLQVNERNLKIGE